MPRRSPRTYPCLACTPRACQHLIVAGPAEGSRGLGTRSDCARLPTAEQSGGRAPGFPMELRLCVGARTSRIGDHHWSRRSYACTACPALLEPRTLMLVMINRLSQARTFRALCRRVVMRALRVRCCPRLPMIHRYDHTARAQCSLLHRALARRPRASTSTPLGDRSFVPIPFTDGIR